MAWRGTRAILGMALLLGLCWHGAAAGAEESRFAATHSRSQYVHWIDLYDATDTKIDPSDPNAPPYSPVFTCGRCHDYEAIAHGYHFNAMQKPAPTSRAGEAWIWTDPRTGTQIPLSYRGWPGTYDPRGLGISAWDFVLKFGRHLPGGLVAGPAPEVSARDREGTEEPGADAATAGPPPSVPDNVPDNGRWKLSGQLAVDCMICHSNDAAYSPEAWWDQISKQNFAWAPAAALGIADIEGDVSKLPDDFDPAAAKQAEPAAPASDSDAQDESQDSPDQQSPAASEGQEGAPAEADAAGDAQEAGSSAGAHAADGPTLPKTRYRALRMSADKKVFFDVVKTPADNACYYCHTTRFASADATVEWTHDEDVHLRAGMTCSDCHRNGIEHDTVRGFEGEKHSTNTSVATLSCRGCHMGDEDEVARVVGGRLGAPKPLHRGLPTIHLELLSCTACHSGPQLDRDKQAFGVQTAMAHGLGLPSHALTADTEPGIVAPVILKSDGVLYPHRTVWPAFWGEMQGADVKPLSPQAVYDTLRTTLRVRGNSTFTETLGKVTLKAEDKAAVLGEERAKVAPAELTADERDKLAQLEKTKSVEAFREKLSAPLKKLKTLIQTPDAQPVYVSGGRVYRLGQDGETVEVLADQVAAAQPYSWKLAHDVRPARWSTGASGGCYECHTLGSPFFDSQVTAVGPAPDGEPPSQRMAELAGLDRLRIDTWNLSFQGRAAFKWFGFASAGIVGLVLLSFVFLGINGLGGFARRS